MSDAEDIAADVADVPQQVDAETPGSPAAYVALPDQVTHTSGSSRIVPTKAELGAEQGVQAALGDQAQAAEEVGAATGEEMEGKALAAEGRGAQGRINEVDVGAEMKRQEAAIFEAQRQADDADEKFKNYKIHDYFDDMGAGQRFLVGLFASVGAWGGGANPGMDILNRRIEMNFRRQQADLMTAEKFAAAKRAGVRDLQGWFEHQNAMLKLKQAHATSAAADEAEAIQIRRGIPKAQAQAHVTVVGFRTLAAKQQLEATQRLATTVHSSLSRVEGKVGAVKGAGGAKEKQDERTVFIGGKPLGLAPTSRTVKPIQDRAVQYDDALESLEALKSHIGSNPITGRAPAGDEYNRAVLAIAATTQANSSDATTHHEALTLKNSIGALSPEAIDRAIEHIKRRQREFLGNLQPIPGLPTPTSTQSGGKRKSLDDLAREHL